MRCLCVSIDYCIILTCGDVYPMRLSHCFLKLTVFRRVLILEKGKPFKVKLGIIVDGNILTSKDKILLL